MNQPFQITLPRKSTAMNRHASDIKSATLLALVSALITQAKALQKQMN